MKSIACSLFPIFRVSLSPFFDGIRRNFEDQAAVVGPDLFGSVLYQSCCNFQSVSEHALNSMLRRMCVEKAGPDRHDLHTYTHAHRLLGISSLRQRPRGPCDPHTFIGRGNTCGKSFIQSDEFRADTSSSKEVSGGGWRTVDIRASSAKSPERGPQTAKRRNLAVHVTRSAEKVGVIPFCWSSAFCHGRKN